MNLTPREKTIVQGLVQGKANKELAHDLGLTCGTVRVLMYRMFRKFNVQSRTQLVVKAFKEGAVQ
jgi:two-component system, NarL family, nitrate/nitrite response regulator NarL